MPVLGKPGRVRKPRALRVGDKVRVVAPVLSKAQAPLPEMAGALAQSSEPLTPVAKLPPLQKNGRLLVMLGCFFF